MITSHMTSAQVCAAANVSFDTVARHIKRGTLKRDHTPGVRGHRFRTADVQRWLGRYYPQRVKEAQA